MFDNLQNTDLVERRRQALEASANQRYQDMLSDLNRQQDVFKGQFESGRSMADQQLAAARALASQNALTQERQARGTYEDLITQARQRARAMGGVTGSGVLDVYGDIDKNLQQNLYGIGQGRERSIGEAQLGANEQFARLQNEYNSRIAQIEADRTKSLREKNDLLSEIEFGYLGALDRMNRENASRRGGSGAYGYDANIGIESNVLGDTNVRNPIIDVYEETPSTLSGFNVPYADFSPALPSNALSQFKQKTNIPERLGLTSSRNWLKDTLGTGVEKIRKQL